MIPKAPFERDLSPESEIAEFERLKGRLSELWTAVFPADDQPYTSVVVPSVHETSAPWSNYLEERLLFHLIGAVSQFGRLGMMAIGDTRADADQLFFRTLRVLDQETRFGRA